MTRTPNRKQKIQFLSSNTQDFIEVYFIISSVLLAFQFLSSNTQDFIEVRVGDIIAEIGKQSQFLSSNTQDFIEVRERMHCLR